MYTDSPASNLQVAVNVLGETYARPVSPETRNEQWAVAARKLDDLASKIPPEFEAPLRYHQARFTALSGDHKRAVAMLDKLAGGTAPLPEVIWLKVQLTHVDGDAESNQRRWKAEEVLASLVPISSWGRLQDGRLTEQTSNRLGIPMTDGPNLPTIPIVDRERLVRIAGLYRDMRMDVETANAFREAIYGGFFPPGFPECGSESWMSTGVAEHWLDVAKSAAAVGRRRLAVHAVLMAVASAPKQAQAAGALLPRIFSDKLEPPRRAPEIEKLTQIASLYCACHVHPRAVQALDEAAKIEGADVSAQRKKTEADWQRLVDDYAQGRDRTCFLFGRKVAETPNRLELSPPPLGR